MADLGTSQTIGRRARYAAGRSAGQPLPEGGVYPALHRPGAAGLPDSSWDVVAGRKRRTGRLTAAGETALAPQTNQWRSFSGSVSKVIGRLA